MNKIVLAYNFGGVKNQLNGLDEIYKINPWDKKQMESRINHILGLSYENLEETKKKCREHIIKNFSVSNALPGPTAWFHHPSLLVIGFIPQANWSPVNA